MEKNMEKTNLEIRKNNRQENRRVDDIRTSSVTFDNPIWQLLEEMEEPRPYKTSDFKKEYFIPDFWYLWCRKAALQAAFYFEKIRLA